MMLTYGVAGLLLGTGAAVGAVLITIVHVACSV